jgi:hypothetical protein
MRGKGLLAGGFADPRKKCLAGGFADPRPARPSHGSGWVSPAVGLDELVPDVLGTAAPDDDDEDDDDDGRSDPNNDCRRFAITKTLKDLRISAVKHLGLFFDFFFFFSDGFAPV